MKFLERFILADEEEHPEFVRKIKNSYTEDEWFPLGFFAKKRLKQIDFEPVTIFYGGNGSGKSTLLNLIAEKLGLWRHADASITKAFTDYTMLCDLRKVKNVILPRASKMLTSEDVFKGIFEAREKNLAIDEKKSEQEEFFDYGGLDYRFAAMESAHMINKDLLKKQYIARKTERKERQFSNGENAIKFFKNEIQRKTLYLLDEPENSMSPTYQAELKLFLENAAKQGDCQLVIATHSPFILAMDDAKIYNLDKTPVTVEKWYELKNVRAYYDFFMKNKDLFELENFEPQVKKRKPAAKKV